MFEVAILAVLSTYPTPAAIRASVERALPPLQAAAQGHIDQKTCFGCHNQSFPLLAFAKSRERGLTLPDSAFSDQSDHLRDFIDQNRDAYEEGRGTGGQADTAGWLLFALEHAGAEADEFTDAVVEYLLRRDFERGWWRTTADRPPSEASSFNTTYVAVRALKKWAGPRHVGRVEPRLQAAKDWLHTARPKDTEDRVFRLWALHLLGTDEIELRQAAQALLSVQRPDGGWAQLPSLKSDAYATGSVLVALHETGMLKANDLAYRRGLAFLIRTQQPDGTWHVKSRSKPFQPYYEGGFPYEKDQFISSTASSWATTALILALPRRVR